MLQVFKVLKSEVSLTGRMDAEYLLGRKSEDKKLKTKCICFLALREVCEFIKTGPAGSMLPSSYYKPTGIPVIRPSNLDLLSCDFSKFVYIAKEFLIKQGLFSYSNEDLLFSRVGDVKFGILYGFETSVVISPNLVGVRVNRQILDPYFLLAFLQTAEAQARLSRGLKKVSMASLGIGDIGQLQVPMLPMAEQMRIGGLVRKALDQRLRGKELLQQAQILLMKPLMNIQTEIARSFPEITLSAVKHVKRMDAEYFDSRDLTNPATELEQKSKVHFVTLGEVAVLARGVEVGTKEYQEKGKMFLRVGNISDYGLLPKSQKNISEDLFKKLRNKYQPRVGEILLVKDGKPGVCCVVQNSVEAIVSEGIVRIRVKKLDVWYVAACLQSEFCQEQIRRDMDGSLVPHWKVRQIEQLLLPVLSEELQNDIQALMSKAYFLFNKATLDNSLAMVTMNDIIEPDAFST